MCEICNVERGNCEVLITEEVEVKVGNRTMTPHLLSMYINNDKGYSIMSDYWIDDGGPMVTINMPIEYCPFCGRRLQTLKRTSLLGGQKEEP